MIPVSLITGFLGSGKTTLLQHIIDRYRDRRFVYVVNECGSVDVDGGRLGLADGQLVRIPGGSIFCRCLSGAFVGHLRTIAEAADEPEAVVIEASGMADPKVISQMLSEHRLASTYDLRRIVSVVEPTSFLKLIHTLPSILAQVESCHLAVINKIDLCDQSDIERTEAEIGRANPEAAVVRTTYGRVDEDILSRSPDRRLQGQYARCSDPRFVMDTVSVRRPVDAKRLAADLESVRNRIYRVKGSVPVDGGMMEIDLSMSALHTHIKAGANGIGQLVFVVSPGEQEAVRGLIAGLRGDALSVL